MKSLARLKAQAVRSATWRGHHLAAWDTAISRDSATTVCTVPGCKAWVQVENHPSPNGIEIGGPAVAVNCPVSGD
jgi:hypothetical protein